VSVFDLLRNSVRNHLRSAELRRKRDPEARAALIKARDLRVEALRLDPERTDPAWSAETVTHVKPLNSHEAHRPTYPIQHDALMAFYAEKLGPPE
jgi:hypothetical protein